jgi:uncharacterized membrane protein
MHSLPVRVAVVAIRFQEKVQVPATKLSEYGVGVVKLSPAVLVLVPVPLPGPVALLMYDVVPLVLLVLMAPRNDLQ